ncbi:MAG: hypothetical protein WC277_12705 [Bacilli bacterium]
MSSPAPASQDIQQFTDALQVTLDSYDLLVERMGVLEDQLSEQGWQRIGNNTREFTREGLRAISRMVRIYWLKNPLIKRAVAIQNLYVWGQGATLRATHPTVDTVVQRVLTDPTNRTVLGDVEALMRLETELQLFGNLFFALFVNPSTGHLKIRTVPFDEIAAIIANPEDAQDPRYYLRVWSTSTLNPSTGFGEVKRHSAYYPDWRYNPTGGHPSHIAGIPVKEAAIYHVSVNRLNDMQFGVSEVYAACDWAHAYKVFLEKWVTITDALSKFAMQLTGANKKAVTGAVSKLQEMLPSLQQNLAEARAQSGGQVGGILATTPGTKLEPIKTSGITTSMDDARRLMLMVCSATGINEPYLTGDPSTGNLATAKSMERPMELQFTARQSLWSSVLENILGYVIDMAAMMPSGPLRAGATVETDDDGDRIVTLGKDPETGEPMDHSVEVKFPPILQHDLLEMVDAIVHAGTLKGAPVAGTIPVRHLTKLLLDALGDPNAQDLVDEWFPQGEQPPADSEAALATAIGKLETYLREAAA